MRVGDFSVEVVAADGAGVRELESGHVLARPGQMYTLRLRNHGPLRCVADVSIDGRAVTGGGLVISAWTTVDLERPIHATERGRFTVVAEGDEHVFGSDGGRDNAALGLIDARFRRELPQGGPKRDLPDYPSVPRPLVTFPTVPGPSPQPAPDVPPGRPFTPPEWTPPTWHVGQVQAPSGRRSRAGIGVDSPLIPGAPRNPQPPAPPAGPRALFAASPLPFVEEEAPAAPATPAQVGDVIERAAGTGLTGSSAQEFVPIQVGPLESEATVIHLRLVIGTPDAIAAARPLPATDATPARPAARP